MHVEVLPNLRSDFRPRSIRLPFHVRYLALRTQPAIRVAMAIQAPDHCEGRDRMDLPHQVDPAVALHAPNAVTDVGRMIEIDELGELMNPLPPKRLILEPAGANRCEKFGLLPNLRVTIHAKRSRRRPGIRRSSGFVMAVHAIDSVISNVVAVVELNGLVHRVVLFRHVGCPHPKHHRYWNRCDADHRHG